MRLVSYRSDQGPRFGVLADGGVVDVGDAAALNQWLPHARDIQLSGREVRTVTDSEMLPPIPFPGKIVCVGLNYRKHASEAGMAIPEQPLLFAKFSNTLTAAGGTVALPPFAEEFDYEGELVAVIGRRCAGATESNALEFVFGYCVGNDLSARDLQFLTSQWLLGKSLDGFLPLGPAVVTSDEVGDPQRLRLRTWVNGELRQDSSTADMVFSIAEIVAYASRHFTLEPGDLIVSGTPEGVISGMAEKRWLRPGDEVVVEIERLGRLRTLLRSAVPTLG